MPWVATDSRNYENIADAINYKLGVHEKYYPSEMPDAILSIEGGGAAQYKQFIQINPMADGFLNDPTYAEEEYDDGDASAVNFQSSIMDDIYRPYAEAIALNRSDAPAIDIEKYPNLSNPYRTDEPVSTLVEIDNDGDFTLVDGESRVKVDEVNNNYKEVYNVTPDALAFYINSINDNIARSGSLKGTGQIRMIHTTTEYGSFRGANVRDLGGWTCDGGSIKYGKIFRGSRFNGGAVSTSEEDKRTFHDLLGIKSEIDLRSNSEVTNVTESAFGSDIVWHHYNVPSSSASYTNGFEDTVYRDIYKQIAYDLSHNNPLYIHCVAGCDRTAIICAVIEGLCGVTRYSIDKDYELSSLVNFVLGSGNVTSEFVRYRTGNTWRGLMMYIHSHYQGETFRDKIVSYLYKIGVTIEEINIIRTNLIDGNPEIITVPEHQVVYYLANASSSNTSSSVEDLGSYTTIISPFTGYTIYGIGVTMGGIDITASAVSGNTITIDRVTNDVVITVSTIAIVYSFTNNLTFCSSTNGAASISYNQRYYATIIPNEGYLISDNDIYVTMRGVDITAEYTSMSDGNVIIDIPAITGALVIKVTARYVSHVYSITLSLNDIATSSNPATNVADGTSYQTYIVPKTGYYFTEGSILICTMGGNLVPIEMVDSGEHKGKGYININSVDGNIVIVAEPAYVDILTSPFFSHGRCYDALGTTAGYRLNSKGNAVVASGANFILVGSNATPGYIPIVDRDKLILSGLYELSATEPITGNYVFYCDENKTGINRLNTDGTISTGTSFSIHIDTISGFYRIAQQEENYVYTVTLGEYRTTNFVYYTNGYSDGAITLNPTKYTRMSFKTLEGVTPQIHLQERNS